MLIKQSPSPTTAPDWFIAFHLRSHFKNLFYVFDHCIKTLESNKFLAAPPLEIHYFLVFWYRDQTLVFVFEIVLQYPVKYLSLKWYNTFTYSIESRRVCRLSYFSHKTCWLKCYFFQSNKLKGHIAKVNWFILRAHQPLDCIIDVTGIS